MEALRNLLENDGCVITGWSAVPGNFYLASLADTGFDAITLDLQHGLHTEESVFGGIAAIANMAKPVIVRVPVGRFDFASRALDAGASAIIAPMVNTAEDAQEFANFMKYPPVGQRSFTPYQAVRVLVEESVNTYLQKADFHTLALAMVETVESVSNLDDILGVDGIDGILVGPADLSISVRNAPKPEPFGDDTLPILAEIAEKTRDAGKIAAIFCGGPENVIKAYDMGYRLIAMGNDQAYLSQGADTMLAQLPFRNG